MKKKVRTLLRVSSRQQLHDDDIPVQRAEAEDYISRQPGWVFDSEYIEKAVSAYKNGIEDREVLKQIMRDARAHEFDVLLAYMSDRIGRKEEYSAYVKALISVGVEVWTIKEGQLKIDEHIDALLNYLRFWQNEGESKKTSARVRDAQREMVKAGKFVGGKAPFGYRLVPSGEISNHGRALKKLEIVETEAEVVRKIYYYAIQRGMGYSRIAKALNEEGISAITTDQWKSATIAGILKNPIYMGFYALNRRVNHGSFTRLDRENWIYSREQIRELVIIPQNDWERAQEIREARKKVLSDAKETSKKLYEEQHNVPFSTSGKLSLIGLAYCGYCGKKLKNGSYCNHWTIKSTGEKKTALVGRYVCPEACDERSCYAQGYLEDIVYQVIQEYLEKLNKLDISEEIRKMQEAQRAKEENELKAVQKEIQVLKLDIETLEEKIPAAMRGDYCFSAEKLSGMVQDREQKLVKLQESEKEIKKKIGQISVAHEDMESFIHSIPNWKNEFENADVSARKMLLSSIIDRIEVKDGDIKIRFKIRLEDFLGDGEKKQETGGSGTTLYTLCSV